MPEIRFDTGLVAYDLNGVCQVSFNPTDAAFVERLYATFDSLDQAQAQHEQELTQTQDLKRLFADAKARDQEMRRLVDGIFGQPVCEALFGDMNLYAMADGLPVWCNLVFSVMDVVDTGVSQEQQRTNPRLKKYMNKYKRKKQA